jgi:hypothetical protein
MLFLIREKGLERRTGKKIGEKKGKRIREKEGPCIDAQERISRV